MRTRVRPIVALAVRLAVTIGVCVFVQACATPTSRLTDLALDSGLQRSNVRAAGYNLMIFDNQKIAYGETKPRADSDDVLRVYLEGDGSPWRHRVLTMADPTPRNPLMLRLMAYDKSPAVYVGRPCYNGTFSESGCDSSLWTSGRYSSKVVQSMASAIRHLATRHQAKQLWLMGHSGGGALAMLLADELPQVTRVVTLAGNLDTDAWTDHHRYTPLYSSTNPADAQVLSAAIWQWHFIGGRDGVIPTQILRPFIMGQASASGFEFPGFNHGCCWERVWPNILQALALDEPAKVPAVQFKFRDSAADVSVSQ